MPDPILVGRNAAKVEQLAKAHDVARWTTDLDAALAIAKQVPLRAEGSIEVRPLIRQG